MPIYINNLKKMRQGEQQLMPQNSSEGIGINDLK